VVAFFVVSVTLSFAEAEQRQANGPALRFFLAEVAIGLADRPERIAPIWGPMSVAATI
jgi:hypothetical protein